VKPTKGQREKATRSAELDQLAKLARKVDPPREPGGRYRKGKKATPAPPRPHSVPE
jgi:hypothetical protein